MSPTVVVLGVGSELESGRHICFGGHDPALGHILEIHKWTLLCQPFYPSLHVNRVAGSGLLPPFLYGAGVRVCVRR